MDIKDMTCTRLFLAPILEVSAEDKKRQNFINAFLDDISHEEHYENAVYFLFKPSDFELFNEFLIKERERVTIIEDYDYEEYVVIVYKFPEELKSDYQLFLEGKYSQFSNKFKSKFAKESTNKYGQKETTLQWRIFTKDKDLKDHWEKEFNTIMGEDNELWRAPDFSEEVLDIEKIKSNV